MTIERGPLITSLKKYFSIKELVCPDVFKKWNERAWQFLDTDLLYCLLLLRETILCRPMYINNYDRGYTQRGLRCNKCQIVKDKATVYLSMHLFGKAIDFTVQGMTPAEVRRKIIENAHLFPCQIRLEADVNWCHLDVMPTYNSTAKVTVFKA